MRKPFLHLVTALAALATMSFPALAAYPEKPIRLIVPSAADAAL
jgi:tripartite-type tricarboxylate transporter receptor subunit TctC